MRYNDHTYYPFCHRTQWLTKYIRKKIDRKVKGSSCASQRIGVFRRKADYKDEI